MIKMNWFSFNDKIHRVIEDLSRLIEEILIIYFQLIIIFIVKIKSFKIILHKQKQCFKV